MSACKFSIPFEGNVSEMLDKAKTAVQNQSGRFVGDTQSGNFEVNVFSNEIIGSYSVDVQSLNILIESKPFIIPCSAIESFLKKQIS